MAIITPPGITYFFPIFKNASNNSPAIVENTG